MLVTLGGLKDPYREEKVFNFVCGTQQQSIDNKLGLMLGKGRGRWAVAQILILIPILLVKP